MYVYNLLEQLSGILEYNNYLRQLPPSNIQFHYGISLKNVRKVHASTLGRATNK